ncbi:MAG TPA: hypothetical protein VJI33_00860 [Candidatus Paceibacterota bacterium]
MAQKTQTADNRPPHRQGDPFPVHRTNLGAAERPLQTFRRIPDNTPLGNRWRQRLRQIGAASSALND